MMTKIIVVTIIIICSTVIERYLINVFLTATFQTPSKIHFSTIKKRYQSNNT